MLKAINNVPKISFKLIFIVCFLVIILVSISTTFGFTVS